MSEFYGRLKGTRDTVLTRGGSKGTGIEATAETWESVVEVSQHMDGDGHLASLAILPKNGNAVGRPPILYVEFNADAIRRSHRREEVETAIRAAEEALRHLSEVAVAAEVELV